MKKHQSCDSVRGVMRRTFADIGNGIRVDYILLCQWDNGRAFYSMEVSDNVTDGSVLVRDITGDRERAKYIFDLVSRGGVTPVCIFEVIEDLIEVTL